MSNQIKQLPTGSAFGLDFNYAVWTADTTVYLSNVPWNSDYRDIVHFNDQAALDAYLATRETTPYTITGMTYAKPGSPVRIQLPFNQVYRFNYLRVTNPAQPIPGTDTPRTFYYFITDVRYVAPNTTELQVQLDVWQTFCRDVTIGNCFIERGHIGIANSQQFDDNGRTYLTVPEGLDVGNEYVIAGSYDHTIATSEPGVATPEDVYGIFVMTTVSLKPPYGDYTNPQLRSANGSNFEDLPSGAETYFFKTPAAFQQFMYYMADKPWITQGIISIMAVPQFTTTAMLNDPFVFDTETTSIPESSRTAYQMNGWKPAQEQIDLAPSFRDSVVLGTRYSRLKKFLTSPYTIVELTTFSGNPLLLKPECIPNDDLKVLKMMHLIPPGARIVLTPMGYNMPKGYDATNQYAGEFLDMATGIFDLPTFSIVNNGYLNYMAANRNSIAYQHTNADWSQNKATTSASYDFIQAQANMSAQGQLTQIGVDAANAHMMQFEQTRGLRMGQGMINGLVHAKGNPLESAMGMFNNIADYGIAVNDNNKNTAISNTANYKSNDARQKAMGTVRDTNLEYANFAAKGDYANALAGINARVQDAKMIQPTTAGQIGGDAFNLSTFKWGVFARIKTLQPAAMAIIGEFWLRYGYAINRFGRMPSSYQVMDTFTYWKLRETYITSSTCPEGFKQTIRGIFEKGVTVWADPAKIGNVDMSENAPLAGVTL